MTFYLRLMNSLNRALALSRPLNKFDFLRHLSSQQDHLESQGFFHIGNYIKFSNKKLLLAY